MKRQCRYCLELVSSSGPVDFNFTHTLLETPKARFVRLSPAGLAGSAQEFSGTYPDLHTLYPNEGEECADVVGIEDTFPTTKAYKGIAHAVY